MKRMIEWSILGVAAMGLSLVLYRTAWSQQSCDYECVRRPSCTTTETQCGACLDASQDCTMQKHYPSDDPPLIALTGGNMTYFEAEPEVCYWYRVCSTTVSGPFRKCDTSTGTQACVASDLETDECKNCEEAGPLEAEIMNSVACGSCGTPYP